LKPRTPVNLTQRAYRAIRDQLISGKLDGRKHLTEGFFAASLGISKSPIREALNRLESDGLIKISPRRGAFVAEFSIHDVHEIFDLREALEALAVRNAVLDSRTLSRIKASARAASAFSRKSNMPNYICEDTKFHSFLAQSSTNLRLRKILENIHDQMALLRSKTFELTSHTSVKQHSQILTALEKGRKDVADKLVVRHIRTVRRSLTDYLKKQESKSRSANELRQQRTDWVKPARAALN
jgi:DNA-binding GntR family transcriptional regulator